MAMNDDPELSMNDDPELSWGSLSIEQYLIVCYTPI